ncbi:MAG: M1 family metallopeptidase [Mariniblastus sp.]|nr:M1 family metallopeptidase [Mariniblastus sp.]
MLLQLQLLRLHLFGWVLVFSLTPLVLHAQSGGKFDQADKFRQLEELLPTPNGFRTGSGAPGPQYWQQQVNYDIDVRLDDENQKLFGKEVITYRNNSRDTLRYLWLQLDANIRRPNSEAQLAATSSGIDRMSFKQLQGMMVRRVFDGGIDITRCVDASTNQPLEYTIVKTMMRVDLPNPLPPGGTFEFGVDWNYRINNARLIRGRSGFEYFPEDGNYIYEMAQWFPRLCAYTDVTGWQHKQFLGRGEFTLEMGDYVVRITVPSDHVVASTGVLMNPDQVLTVQQRQRLEQAKNAKEPVFIVTPGEALANETSTPNGERTWVFKADQVRDFAFASSRKFIWDAVQHNVGQKPVMAMSFYPKEGEPLWSRYSTHAIVHTLNVYSRYTFDYPYPVAISVNGPVGGMEYPMICFNGPRPEKDGTYSARTKYGLISVIIHEVGHNYFPMIVNTDERQWTWMDEGLNTFLQFLSEQEWEEGYPSRRGEPADIVGFMGSTNQVPIMTNSESLLQFGANAYAKPATALNILRETILGRELFDFAFKEYARRWKFKRPMPADFFRTMEDASGVDLDWFWRGWFYSTDHVDLAIAGVRRLNIDTADPNVEKTLRRTERGRQPETLSSDRNKPLAKYVDAFPGLKDFYNEYDPLDVTAKDREVYEKFVESLSNEERALLQSKQHFYLIDIKNVGGLVMPIILQLFYEDGSSEVLTYPAEIWNKNNELITKLIILEKPIASIILDPRLETADVDLGNNFYPPKIEKSRFQLFKDSRDKPNPMREQRAADSEASGGEGGEQ